MTQFVGPSYTLNTRKADVQRVINGGETNYIMATLAIYLDVYNVFTNLLALLGIVGGNRD